MDIFGGYHSACHMPHHPTQIPFCLGSIINTIIIVLLYNIKYYNWYNDHHQNYSIFALHFTCDNSFSSHSHPITLELEKLRHQAKVICSSSHHYVSDRTVTTMLYCFREGIIHSLGNRQDFPLLKCLFQRGK